MRLAVLLALCAAASIAAQDQSADVVPAWQKAAGGKAVFDVASVKPAKVWRPPNFSLSATKDVVPGGRLSAVFPFWVYIQFAYKISPNSGQRRAILEKLPKWVNEENFEIEGKAEGNATKDQMRLMMQALLAERFKLALHFETRDTAVMELTLVKPDRLGLKIRLHSEGPPCPADDTDDTKPSKAGNVFPPQCDDEQVRMHRDGKAILGSRNATPDLLAEAVQSGGSMAGEVDRPVVDRTGLDGNYDFTIEWSGRPPGPPQPGTASPAPPPDQQVHRFCRL